MTLGVFIGFDVANLVERLVSFDVLPVLVLAGAALLVLLAAGLRPMRHRHGRHLRHELLLLSGVWLGFALGDAATYLLLEVSLWNWYAIAIFFALAFAAFAASVCAAGIAWPSSPRGRVAALAVALLLAGAVAETGGRCGPAHRLAQWLGGRNINGHLTSYQKAIELIERDSPAGASVAICEPGAFGFKLGPRYRIVDELGLTSPGVARAILRGDMDYPFRTWKPDYIVLSWHGPYSPEGRPWLAAQYDEVLAFTDPYFLMNHLDKLYVYRRKSDRPSAAGSG
jgi:arabinofuranosyltransferase